MTSEQFYAAAGPIVRIEWWLMECSFPSLCWARMSVYESGFAEVCWEVDEAFGFADVESARHFLWEDEFVPLTFLDGEDEMEFGIRISEIVPPNWPAKMGKFRFLGVR